MIVYSYVRWVFVKICCQFCSSNCTVKAMKLESSIVKTKIRAANFSLLLKELEEINTVGCVLSSSSYFIHLYFWWVSLLEEDRRPSSVVKSQSTMVITIIYILNIVLVICILPIYGH